MYRAYEDPFRPLRGHLPQRWRLSSSSGQQGPNVLWANEDPFRRLRRHLPQSGRPNGLRLLCARTVLCVHPAPFVHRSLPLRQAIGKASTGRGRGTASAVICRVYGPDSHPATEGEGSSFPLTGRELI